VERKELMDSMMLIRKRGKVERGEKNVIDIDGEDLVDK
jgi:hypothetical protein